MNLSMITLRPFTESDADAMMTWASDPRVVRFQRRHPFITTHEAMSYIQTHIISHPFYRAICFNAHVVGSISVKPGTGDGEQHKASVGYRLAYEHWGKGIATAALKMVVEIVLKEWEWLERLEGMVDLENKGSQRVLEKAGFQKEGVLHKFVFLKGEARDMVMYSIIRSSSSSSSFHP
ncbi:Amino-acid N-acetyltransferase protein [Dioscorea alata]|uniref:Amino-acid N-acetyltransferase protein n=1 Tax=Dioscorea alata TaxID=55571 RepID=A0ACB7UM49_DIOAL|nr:Amino-acid N-acetyltransferase protein [Dioscorea alata]